MGLRNWWRRFTQHIQEVYNKFSPFGRDEFTATATFFDGSTARWEGAPRGVRYQQWEDLCRFVLTALVRTFRKLTVISDAMWIVTTYNGKMRFFRN
jgi:hypothetical protein